MLVVAVILVSLLSLGGYAVVSVRGGTAAAGHKRFTTIARYAAESGIAAGMEYLRKNVDETTYWTAVVVANNDGAGPNTSIVGNTIEPGDAGNVFDETHRAWYEVTILNNEDDSGFATGDGDDTDGRVRLRSMGYGPNGTVAIVEVDMTLDGAPSAGGVPCPGYAQKNITELGAGHNPCLGTINSTEIATFKPEG